jgi:hypothetical protein
MAPSSLLAGFSRAVRWKPNVGLKDYPRLDLKQSRQ